MSVPAPRITSLVVPSLVNANLPVRLATGVPMVTGFPSNCLICPSLAART